MTEEYYTMPPNWGPEVLYVRVLKDWGFTEEEIKGLTKSKDNIFLILCIAADLDSLYRHDAFIKDWMNEIYTFLGKKTPKELILENSTDTLQMLHEYIGYLGGLQ